MSTLERVYLQRPSEQAVVTGHVFSRPPPYVPSFLSRVGCRIVVVFLALTRVIKCVVTGQAPVTLEWNNTSGKKRNKPKVVHAYGSATPLSASFFKVVTGLTRLIFTAQK